MTLAADPEIESIRRHCKAILSNLPPEPLRGNIDAVITEMKALLPNIAAAPWYLSEVSDEEGYDVQTLGADEPPHYEEMVAQFYPGNHGTAPGELVLLVLNNLEDIIATLERARE